ncbi:MAG: hypothetical protein QNJ72_40720 [Pleurocapsa sp. MO_226.B13]|nr:hypothetical protein [Pleurocapsa sp. MO_226.B13]
MSNFSKNNRPPNLSDWVFFATEKDPNVCRLAGGDAEYLLRVRAANKPVISIHQASRGKYRWTVEMDLIEGFDGSYKVKLSPPASKKVFEIMHSINSIQPDDLPSSPFFFFGDAQYSSVDDAITVANQLAALPDHSYVKRD